MFLDPLHRELPKLFNEIEDLGVGMSCKWNPKDAVECTPPILLCSRFDTLDELVAVVRVTVVEFSFQGSCGVAEMAFPRLDCKIDHSICCCARCEGKRDRVPWSRPENRSQG